LACATSQRSFIVVWNVVGSMWQNMMGITCRSEAIRFSTTTNELGMALRSSYIDYERSCFPCQLLKSNSWLSFGSSS
jgi:hypothetical protein